MMSDRLLPCRVLLVWSLIVALILPVPLGGCVARKQDGVGFVSGASSGRAANASRADVAAVGPEKDADRAGDADRERPRGLNAAMFNVVATFMGLPGLAPSTGARDEGLGYHQDGTVRRAGSADAFAFRVTDGLGRAWAGKTVWVRADNVTLAVAPQPSRSLLSLAGDVLGGLFGAREAHAATASHSYVTDSQGCFTVRVTSPLSGPVTLHVRAGENERSFTVNVVANATLKMSASSAALTQGTTRRVTFTFTRNGVAQSGLEVRFAANAAFRELAQGAVTDKTDSDGRVTLELTALTNDTSQTISVEADGQTLTQSFTVTPGKYALTAEPGSLTQHRETELVFTLTQGGIPVPKGTQITLSGEGVTFDGKAQYTCVTEDASGAITAKVIVSRTDASIIATVDGGATATVKLQVTAAKYSLEASPSTLTQHKAEQVVFTLKADGQPLPNAKVTFTHNDNFSGLPEREQTTDSEGQITVDNLKALKSGTLAVSATVEGQTVEAEFVVTKAVYTLTADPATLTLDVGTEVTFTLTRNDNPLGDTAVTLSGDNLTFSPAGATTDKDGKFTVKLTATGSGGNRTITATVGTDTVTVDLYVGKVTFVLTDSGGDPQFTKNKQTKTLKAKLTDAAGTEIPLDARVTWTVESSTISPALKAWNRDRTLCNGLTWGTAATASSPGEGNLTSPQGDAPDGAEASLTDIVGQRTVEVKATVKYGEQTYTQTTRVSFGDGPLSVFAKPPSKTGETWAGAATYCGGDPGDASLTNVYQRTTNLPTSDQLRAVSGGSGYGAAFAAGWPDSSYGGYTYWTGQAGGYDNAGSVGLTDSYECWVYVENDYYLAVCLP